MKIETENLCFSYGEKKLLNGISLTLEPGQFTVLLGPNGGGKSTLLKLLTELLRDSGGAPLQSGSGSTLFALYPDKSARDRAADELAPELGKYHASAVKS